MSVLYHKKLTAEEVLQIVGKSICEELPQVDGTLDLYFCDDEDGLLDGSIDVFFREESSEESPKDSVN